MKYLTVCILLMLGFMSCEDGEPSLQDIKSEIVLSIGQGSLSFQLLEARKAILELEEQADPQNLALFQITQTLALETIAKQAGFILKQEDLDYETTRIDSNSWHPEKIAAIKNALKGDIDLYQAAFIKVSLLPRWLPTRYYWDKKRHRATAVEATSKFGKLLVQPDLMKEDSSFKTFVLTSAELKIKEELPKTKEEEPINGIIDLSKQKNPIIEKHTQENIKSQKSLMVQQLNEALANLEVGQLAPQPLEWKKEYWIVQIIAKTNSETEFNMISIPKQDYFEWLKERIAQVPIEVIDTLAWETMLKTIPSAKNLFQNIQ